MPRVLLVRVSSLGDVVQTFPAVTELAKQVAGLRLDWIVEESYDPRVEMHAVVTRAIPFGLRRWRLDARWHRVGKNSRIFGGRYESNHTTRLSSHGACLKVWQSPSRRGGRFTALGLAQSQALRLAPL